MNPNTVALIQRFIESKISLGIQEISHEKHPKRDAIIIYFDESQRLPPDDFEILKDKMTSMKFELEEDADQSFGPFFHTHFIYSYVITNYISPTSDQTK